MFLFISCGGDTNKNTNDEPQTVKLTQEESNTNKINNWKVSNHVDSFNEETDKQYIKLGPVKGTFTNSITTNSSLTAVIEADADRIYIKLFEYGGNLPAELKGNVVFRVKEKEGEEYEIKTYNGYTHSKTLNTSDSLFRAILSRGGELKFSANFKQYGNETNYNFVVPNADHFQDAINLIVKK